MAERTELLATLDECCAALGANDAGRLDWAKGARFAENCVEMPAGDGVWGTCTAIGE